MPKSPIFNCKLLSSLKYATKCHTYQDSFSANDHCMKTNSKIHTNNFLLPNPYEQCCVAKDKPSPQVLPWQRTTTVVQSVSEKEMFLRENFGQFCFYFENNNTHGSIVGQVLFQIFVVHEWEYDAGLLFMQWYSQQWKYVWVVQFHHIGDLCQEQYKLVIFHFTFNCNIKSCYDCACLLSFVEQDLTRCLCLSTCLLCWLLF